MVRPKAMQQPSKSDDANTKKTRLQRSSDLHPLLQLQQTIGNRAVTSLIQRHGVADIKLDIARSAPGEMLSISSSQIGFLNPEEERGAAR